jgi:ABC-type nitrate/sulfonate/bicarbonate transport system permease component
MTPRGRGRLRGAGEVLLPFATAAVAWELFAAFGPLPARLFPSLGTVARTFWRLAASGVLLAHARGTVVRLVLGFLLAAVLGVAIGIAMGRYRWAEDLLLPLVSLGSPIPGLAYAPLFVLWFGLGDLPAVLLVAVAAAFPAAVNTWTGVRAVKVIWIRAAEAMGAPEHQLFRKVILPGALPHVLTGLRLALARAWRVLVAVEMLTSVPRGLGWLIFGAREFLYTDVMLAGIAVIGILGLVLERGVFARLERFTVVRWGMLA